ncbi:MAG: ATP-binding protein [Candidatus Obscuribacterales bacterium]|nr:ATP-binding protein [Candidatus Obscuribacterales bacterium]
MKRKTTNGQAGKDTQLEVAPASARPRLHKMTIRNFRCINDPVTIELDDIVVLVGPNNAGKSSILRAYEVVTSEGSARGELTIDDFPNRKVNLLALPEIELETVVFDSSPGTQWLREENGETFVREIWSWDGPGQKPKRQGFDVTKGEWSDQRPWGAANVANSRRPIAHRLSAFDTPEETSNKVVELLMQVVNEKVKSLKKGDSGSEHKDTYQQLLGHVKELQDKLIESSREKVNEVESELSRLVSDIFPDYRVSFGASVEDDLEKTVSLFKGTPELLMGPTDGFLSKIENQGSGAQRTLMWSTLRMLAENYSAVERPHVLLLDEPEICLHPSLVREAARTLYDLPQTGHWQVMVTTHSPVFIDFSRDNTTVIKVERQRCKRKHTHTYKHKERGSEREINQNRETEM